VAIGVAGVRARDGLRPQRAAGIPAKNARAAIVGEFAEDVHLAALALVHSFLKTASENLIGARVVVIRFLDEDGILVREIPAKRIGHRQLIRAARRADREVLQKRQQSTLRVAGFHIRIDVVVNEHRPHPGERL